MSTQSITASNKAKIHIPTLCLVILVLTSAFSLTVSMAQTRYDGLTDAIVPLAAAVPAAAETDSSSPPPVAGGAGQLEMVRVATEIYDRSLGSLKVTLAVMISVIGGGMVLVMLYLGYVDQQRRQQHEYLLTNAQKVGQQIHASAQELRAVFLEAREWEQDVSGKLRERYELHVRKNRQLMEELDAARTVLRTMEQEVANLTDCLPDKLPLAGPGASATTRAAGGSVKDWLPEARPDETGIKAQVSRPAVSTPSAAPSVLHQRQEIIDKVHRMFERELQKQPDNPSVYLNWGNACLKLANRLKGAEREAMLELAREKWMLAERTHAGTARRQLSVLNAIAGLEGQSHAWSHIQQSELAGQGI